jgi:phosphoglycerol transferase MdoB-like AlkP superfamily enzyme
MIVPNYLIPGMVAIQSLDPGTVTISHLWLAFVPITTYLLVAVFVILAVATIKKLKPWRERGIIYLLVWGLVVCIGTGLFSGLLVSYVWDVSRGLAAGLLWGLLGGLYFFLAFGLRNEFQ